MKPGLVMDVGDGRPVRLAPGINIVEGDVEVDDDVDLAHDPTIVLRVAQASARSGHRIGRHPPAVRSRDARLA